jgi:hypothetical protein
LHRLSLVQAPKHASDYTDRQSFLCWLPHRYSELVSSSLRMAAGSPE